MHFPKFWMLVRRGGVSGWGWSDVSAADARAVGEASVARIVERLSRGDLGKAAGPYGYPDRPMREEVLQELAQPEGRAVVTRNSYGCLILNSTHALFVDVDEPGRNVFQSLLSLFRKEPAFEEVVMAKAAAWVDAHPGWGWRVYRTKAGIRLLATHAPISVEALVTEELFQEFRADVLYRKLCVNQKCYRARLTPKSWRCGLPQRCIHQWPWPSAEAEAAFRQWEQAYRTAAASFATCKLLGQIGVQTWHSSLAGLVAFHDAATGAESGRALA